MPRLRRRLMTLLRFAQVRLCNPANHALERFFVHICAKATRSLYELRLLILSFLLAFSAFQHGG